jgi:uncharacterized protein (DUF1015 family)
MSPKSIYIADGHHRYETALAYRDERKSHSISPTGNEAYNFILMTLVSFSDPGIVMLPVHRLVKKVPPTILEDFKKLAPDYFEVSSDPITRVGIDDRKGTDLRVLGLEEGRIVTLRPRNLVSLKQMMPPGHSQAYYALDLSVLDHVIFENLFAGSVKENNLVYTPYSENAAELVESGEYQLAFLINTLPTITLKNVADSGDRMPRKSTYFYPKLPTGLVISRLDGKL